MNRFSKTAKKNHLRWSFIFPIFLFLFVLGLFLGGLRSIDAAAQNEQLRSLRQTITRMAVHCYAVEGFYPPDLDYLKENYGLQVDDDQYLVDYRCFASNIVPDVFVMPKSQVA
jgi:hypothetical protein